MKLASIFAAFTLASCVTDQDLHTGMTMMVGKPLSEAVGVLGYPQSSQMIGSKKVYTWGREATTLPINGAPIAQLKCELQVGVDKNEIITDYHVQGSRGACERFTVPLYHYAKSKRSN